MQYNNETEKSKSMSDINYNDSNTSNKNISDIDMPNKVKDSC